MTLNITVLTRDVLYQSADYRLTSSATGAVITDLSPKIVTLREKTWDGLLTYAGLGGWDSKHTSEWLTAWLAQLSAPTVDDVAQCIAGNARNVFARVLTPTGSTFRHTFTLAAFERERARLIMVSNFENCFGDCEPNAAPSFTVTDVELGRRATSRIIVTGQKKAMSRVQRILIKRLAGNTAADPAVLRRQIQATNAEVARSPNSRETVSSDCIVVSLRRDGQSYSESSRTVPGPMVPGVIGGIDTTAMMKDVLRKLGLDPEKSFVGGTATSSRESATPLAAKPPCVLKMASPDANTNYRIRELAVGELETRNAVAINSSGSIIGTGGTAGHLQDCVPWIFRDGSVRALGIAGLACAVNDRNDVVGTFHASPTSDRAARWDEKGLMHELDLSSAQRLNFEPTDSVGIALNNSGDVVGSVLRRGFGTGVPVFCRDDFVVAFRAAPPHSTTHPVAVTDAGLVLIGIRFSNFRVRSVIWDPINKRWMSVGSDSIDVNSIAMNEKQTILGQARDTAGLAVAVMARMNEVWKPMGTAAGWSPTALNNLGDVVGFAMMEGIQRPWICDSKGNIELLPYAREHHTLPSAINDGGEIVGAARSDHGSHAVVWSRDRDPSRSPLG